MIKDLIKLANTLDRRGFSRQADYVDRILRKLAQMDAPDPDKIIEELSKTFDLDDHKKSRILKFLKIKNLTYGNKEGRKGEVSTASKLAENFKNSNKHIGSELEEAERLWSTRGNWDNSGVSKKSLPKDWYLRQDWHKFSSPEGYIDALAKAYVSGHHQYKVKKILNDLGYDAEEMGREYVAEHGFIEPEEDPAKNMSPNELHEYMEAQRQKDWRNKINPGAQNLLHHLDDLNHWHGGARENEESLGQQSLIKSDYGRDNLIDPEATSEDPMRGVTKQEWAEESISQTLDKITSKDFNEFIESANEIRKRHKNIDLRFIVNIISKKRNNINKTLESFVDTYENEIKKLGALVNQRGCNSFISTVSWITNAIDSEIKYLNFLSNIEKSLNLTPGELSAYPFILKIQKIYNKINGGLTFVRSLKNMTDSQAREKYGNFTANDSWGLGEIVAMKATNYSDFFNLSWGNENIFD